MTRLLDPKDNELLKRRGLRQARQAEREALARRRGLDGSEGKFHQIGLADISPFGMRSIDRTVYAMGSPGSGKTVMMQRLEQELENATLIVESGVWDLFKDIVIEYFRQHRCIDRGIRFPHIDGLHYHDGKNLDITNELSKVTDDQIEEVTDLFMGETGWDRNYVFWAYREAIRHISSGGKSAFPDRLFYTHDSEVRQVISIPGHYRIENVAVNRSIPSLERPDAVVYLVDPLISDFNRDFGRNVAAEKCPGHLADVLSLEEQGVPVYWFLSKTPATLSYDDMDPNLHIDVDDLTEGEDKAIDALKIYRRQAVKEYSRLSGLGEIVRRVPTLLGFDSLYASRKELFDLFGPILLSESSNH